MVDHQSSGQNDDPAPTAKRKTNAADLAKKINPQRVLDLLLHDLNENFGSVRTTTPDILQKIVRPLNKIRNGFRIEQLGDESGFRLDAADETMVLNKAAIEAMISMIAQHPATGSLSDAVAVGERLIEAYAFHELHHVHSNLAAFSNVQRLKIFGSTDLLGIVDAVADHDAARFISAIHMARLGGNDRRRFLEEFLKTLVLVNEIAPRTFKCPADKPHKQRRFLGSAISTGLLNTHLTQETWKEFEERSFSLETAIYPYFDVSTGQMMLVEIPGVAMIQPYARVPPQLLKATVDGLDKDPLSLTLERIAQMLPHLEARTNSRFA